ncbi:MAG: hypothetical protein JW809_18175 [Pirellulales bacterium]|nr:hypothetical protein [Pirellulales bacterium]
MIQVACTHCGVRLNAKEELAGKTRKCPKCGGLVAIPQPTAASDEPTVPLDAGAETPTPIIHGGAAEAMLPAAPLLPRLVRQNRYLICDKTSVVATWDNDGRGWMIRVASGFSPARRNRDVLPAFGQFVLVALEMATTAAGLRLEAVESYRLASRLALPKLAQGDDAIVEAVVERIGLTRAQKNATRVMLGELLMRDVWGDSADVLDFLANADYHSSSSRK